MISRCEFAEVALDVQLLGREKVLFQDYSIQLSVEQQAIKEHDYGNHGTHLSMSPFPIALTSFQICCSP